MNLSMASFMGLKTISPGDLHRAVLERRVTVIDVNSSQSWNESHVPGALNLDPAGYGPAELPPDKDSSLVFYCSNPMCGKAPRAARRAVEMGYANVAVMAAGIRGWLSGKLPVERGE